MMKKFSAMRKQGGFTLIELMIVVAIIGILAAVAVPQYNEYTKKSKLSNAVNVAEPLKTAIGMYYQENSAFPTADDDWTGLGLSAAPSATKYVSAVSVAGGTGAIELTLGNIGSGIDGQTLTLTPTPGSTSIVWDVACSGADAICAAYAEKMSGGA